MFIRLLSLTAATVVLASPAWAADYKLGSLEIDPAWAGELPRTVMIDREGKATVLPGVADLAQVRQWLDAQSKSH